MNKFTHILSTKKFTIIGIMSIIVGSTYLFELYAKLEGEVKTWGLVAVVFGVFSVILDSTNSTFIRGFLSLNTFIILSLQPLPIYLWFEYHGYRISDTGYLGKFVAHWAFSFSHILILILCAITLFYQIKFKK